jgi:glycosyltransferase involved in cell wall biosynthesis
VLEHQLDVLGDRADPRAVFDRTTAAIEGLLRDRFETPAALRPTRSRPRLAVVSPFPPQRSGVADYTALTLRQVAKYADVEVYSGARPDGRASFPIHPITTEPYLDRQFDSVVNVLGNSHFHFPALDLMESYGGACIAHDNRMIEAYRYYLGDARTAELLSTPTQLVRPETIGELLLDLDTLPSIGYQVIARQASPLIVHGRALAERIQHETGVAAKVVPFVPYNVPARTLTEKELERSRAELGLASDVLHVATFGFVDRRTKGADIIVGAAAWLRSWAVPLELHIVGEVSPEERRLLEQLRDDLELGDLVVFHGRVSAELLNHFLLAVDVAVQLRTSTVLSLSGALADCIAFGVPTITTQDIADEMDAPSYVQAVNSLTSSLLVAEAIDGLRQLRRTAFEKIEDERRDYLSRRSVDAYARSLLEALGLDWT